MPAHFEQAQTAETTIVCDLVLCRRDIARPASVPLRQLPRRLIPGGFAIGPKRRQDAAGPESAQERSTS